MIEAKVAIGPLSSEIIEAVFRYSHYHRTELMLIASKNQIDYSGGYVNNWTTKEFMEFINQMKNKYPFSNVKICRDHCGPGFNEKYDLDDVYKTIKSDIENKFDLIHIDFCHFKGSKEERFEASKQAIMYCMNLNPSILLEVGTDENIGARFGIHNLDALEEEINFFTEFCKPVFYVVQTGSLVREINQVGSLAKDFIIKASKILKAKGIKLKEHNADYLTTEELASRKGLIDAVNIAPQLGVVQTSLVLTKCLVYGIPFKAFLEVVYQGGKWKKWTENNLDKNKFLCSLIAGHYHFTSPEYKKLIKQLEQKEDIHEEIINTIMEVIDHYENSK